MEAVKDKVISVSLREEKLINTIRELGFGELIIHVTDNQPIRVEQIKKSIKL